MRRMFSSVAVVIGLLIGSVGDGPQYDENVN